MIKANLIKEMKGSQRYVIVNVVWQWIALISQIFAAVSISVLIAGMYLKDVVLEKVWITLIIVGISIGVKILCEKFSATFAYKASYDVKNRLRKSIYDKIISLGTSYRETASTSELIQLSVEISSTVHIQHFSTYYSVLCHRQHVVESSRCAVDMRTANPAIHSGRTENRQEVA